MASRSFTVEYNDTFNVTILQTELTQDEGRELRIYPDTLGIMSIGIGRNLEDPGISNDECDFMWLNSVVGCCEVMDQNIPWWRKLEPNEQRVMINLCFMGWSKFAGFHNFMQAMQNMIAARERNDANTAAQAMQTAVAELKNSKWWQQVKTRGPRVVERLTGVPAGSVGNTPSV